MAKNAFLTVENLSQNWGDVELFEDLNFGINEGQKIGLIARNGEGKTTLLNILAGKTPAQEGTVSYNKEVILAYLLQDPDLNDDNTVIEAIFSEDTPQIQLIKKYELALANNNTDEISHLIEQIDKLNAWDFELQAKLILSKLKINWLDKKISELSGGQKKRIALANILIQQPNFILLDEPTNHLDLDMIEWLEDYLKRAKTTLLMVTHDRYFLDRVCEDIFELADSQIYQYTGNYQYFVTKREERIQNQATQIEKAKNLLKKEQDWMNRQPQARATKAKYRIDAFHELKSFANSSTQENNLELNIESSRLGKKIIECDKVSKAFGDNVILKDFTYKFSRGEKLGIIGQNGTGKSTFLNTITGSIDADSGIIEYGETLVVGYYKQGGISINDDKKVIDVISDISEKIDLGQGNELSAAQFLRYFMFPNNMHHVQVNKLSGGEKKRLYLMTVLVRKPNFLILDEPTNDLDIFTLNILEEYLRNFNGCVIIVSHDRYFMDKIVDHIFVFEGAGQINDVVGNYTDYYAQKCEQEKQAKKLERANKPVIETKKEKPKTKKLSFKQQKELESLETDLENHNKEKQDIEEKLNSGTLNATELTELSQKLGELIDVIDEKEMQWLELSELKG